MSKSGRPIDPDNIDESDLPDNWVEEKSEALKDVLGEMTSVYNAENEPIDLKFAEQSHADINGEYVAVNPRFWQEVDPPVAGPNILRVLDELNSHEVGHYNWSDLGSKKEFGEMYPGWGEIPGHVANILEDEYVDARKMREWYGLRRKRAYRVKLQLDTDRFTPDINDVLERAGKTNALVTALHQTALCGAVRGVSDAPEYIAEFCATVEPVISRVRRQDDPHERMKLFHITMQILRRYVDDPEDFDEDDFEEGPGKTVSGEPEESPDTDEVDPEDAMSESIRDMIERAMEEMAEDGDLPMDPDSGDIEVKVTPVEVESGEDEEGGEGGEAESEIGPDEDDLSSGLDGDSSELESEMDELGDDADAAPDESGDGEGESDGEETGEEDGSGTGSGSESGGDEDADSEGERPPDGPIEAEMPDELDEDAPPPRSDIDGGRAKHHVDDVEDFKSRDAYDEVENRYDVKLDEVDKVDNRDRVRWASLVKQLNEYGHDVEERKRERDERTTRRREKFSHREKRLSEGLKRRAENAGIIRELKEGFEELVSRPMPTPARRGTRIDPINVSRRAAGDVTVTELFEDEQIVETGERCIGLATDISGSMGSAIDELKIAGAAIGKATDIIGDEFVWEAFTDKHGTGEDALDLRIVTGPSEEFDWEHLDSFGSARNEPTAAGVRDCFNLMQQTDANEYVMIVITDGMALITEDGRRPGNNEPVEQARQAVDEIRSQGVDVIGLGIGSMDESRMEQTFGGKNYRLTSIDRLADDILELYKEQMDVVNTR